MTAGFAEKLAAAPAVQAAREALPPDVAARTWIVGGAVRDAVLGREVTDVDLAVPGGEDEVAKLIARHAGAARFEISGEFATWRVVARDGSWHLDIARFRGGDDGGVEDDLRLRDLTINAIAVPLPDRDPATLDPTGGLGDLHHRRLRAVSARSFSDDPLRVLRLARFVSTLGFEVEPESRELAFASAAGLADVAGERVFAELKSLIGGDDPIAGLEEMAATGATAVVLPELEEMRGVTQGPNHHLDVHDHTIDVLRHQIDIEKPDRLEEIAPGRSATIAQLLAEPLADELDRRVALRFAALLHDVAKPATRKEHDGLVGFRGHDVEGARMINAICRRLRTSRAFANYLGLLTREHLRLGFLVPSRPLNRREVFRYLKATDPAPVDVTLLTVADRLAARGPGPLAAPEMIAAHLGLVDEILGPAIEWQRSGPPPRPANGDEIAQAAGIEPGPELGRLLEAIDEAVYAGEVETREDAFELARQLVAGQAHPG